MQCTFGVTAIGLPIVVCFVAFPDARKLTLVAHVTVHWAIGGVHYDHQIAATESFEEEAPRTVLESKVSKYIERMRREVFRKTRLTSEMLQCELTRMAAGPECASAF